MAQPQHNTTYYNTQLLIRASDIGDADEIKRLIPISNPAARESYALRRAALLGHMEIVKLLIPVSNPQDNNSDALVAAAYNGHIECVKLLIPVSDCNSALSTLQDDGEDTTLLQQCVDEHEALQLKERLNNTLAQNVEDKNNSNKRKI